MVPPSSFSRCKSDGSPGFCGLDLALYCTWLLLYMLYFTCFPSELDCNTLGTPIFRVTVSSPGHNKESFRGHDHEKKHDPLCDDARTQISSAKERLPAKETPCQCNAMIYHDASEPSPVGSSDFCGVYNGQAWPSGCSGTRFFARV